MQPTDGEGRQRMRSCGGAHPLGLGECLTPVWVWARDEGVTPRAGCFTFIWLNAQWGAPCLSYTATAILSVCLFFCLFVRPSVCFWWIFKALIINDNERNKIWSLSFVCTKSHFTSHNKVNPLFLLTADLISLNQCAQHNFHFLGYTESN